MDGRALCEIAEVSSHGLRKAPDRYLVQRIDPGVVVIANASTVCSKPAQAFAAVGELQIIRPCQTIYEVLFSAVIVLIGRNDEQSGHATPTVGLRLRRQLLYVVSGPTEEHSGQHVVFAVNTLRASGSWTLFVGEATQPTGKPADYRKSKEFKGDPMRTQNSLRRRHFVWRCDRSTEE